MYPSKSLSFDFHEKLVKIGSYKSFEKFRNFGKIFESQTTHEFSLLSIIILGLLFTVVVYFGSPPRTLTPLIFSVKARGGLKYTITVITLEK